MSKLTFSIGWKSTLLTLVVVPLCLYLGLWQLQRADEKADIADMYAQRSTEAPISLAEAESVEDKTNIAVTLTGAYKDQHWLLENQWRNKVLGVDVLSLFETTDGQHVLVNRGWLENRQRDSNPSFVTPSGLQQIRATVYQPSKDPYTLGALILDDQQQVTRIPYLDIAQISASIDTDLYPYSLRLSGSEGESFDTNWPQINVKPETHIGYAVQWFLFAALAVIVFIFANSNLGSLLRKRDS